MKSFIKDWLIGFFPFVYCLGEHIYRCYVMIFLSGFESVKSTAVLKMYQRRGRYAQLVVHAVVVMVMVLGVSLGPSLIVSSGRVEVGLIGGANKIVFAANENEAVLGAQTIIADQEGWGQVQTLTQVSDKPRSEVIKYEVVNGDTLSSVVDKFGVSLDTVRWANRDKIESIDSIKPGMMLLIPPVTGVVHIVKSGETIYSIAKKYNTESQSIVDFPFNIFTNDETFALAVGQKLMVPDGVMPASKPWRPSSNLARVMTPDAGMVSATGAWIWPTSGRISQPFRSWHKAVDIANKSGGAILAADSGVVVVAGWPDNFGYGNRVMIDHGNGYKTLYAHMSRIAVRTGQTVERGAKIGDMGSTGRSTGTHLHFEIRSPQGNINPLSVLE